MTKYILKRIALALITTIIILSITFILIKLLPFQKPIGTNADCFSYYMNEVYQGFVIDNPFATDIYGELLWKYTDTTGVDHYFYQTPVMTQYFAWVKNIVTEWNWGYSTFIMPNMAVSDIILLRLPVTIKLNLVSTLISVPVGIALGVFAALKKNTKTDHFISTSVVIYSSIPGFISITVLLLIFGYTLNWVPTQWPSAMAPFGTRFIGYFIPVSAMCFGSIAFYTRFVRAELCEVMSSDYLLLARTKGLTKKQAIKRHALRNSMVPVLPAIIADFMSLLGGSMILEKIYGIPGVGSLFILAINHKDYNVLFVNMAIFTTMGLMFSVIIDLSYGFIDPQIRMGAKK